MTVYTYQQKAAEITAKKSRNTIDHISRVRLINGSAVSLEFKLGIIIRPLEKWMRCVEWYRGRGVVVGLSYPIIAYSRTCYGLITMCNYDLNFYLIKIFYHTFRNFIIPCSRLLTNCSSLMSWRCPMSFLHFMMMALIVDCDFENRVMLAAEIVSSCGNCFWLRKRFPAAETETTPI